MSEPLAHYHKIDWPCPNCGKHELRRHPAHGMAVCWNCKWDAKLDGFRSFFVPAQSHRRNAQ